jgi:hypothetical protein
MCEVNLNKAQAIVRAAYPEYAPNKSGRLFDGVYLIWANKAKPVGTRSPSSKMATAFFVDKGMGLADHLDGSHLNYSTMCFGVKY